MMLKKSLILTKYYIIKNNVTILKTKNSFQEMFLDQQINMLSCYQRKDHVNLMTEVMKL